MKKGLTVLSLFDGMSCGQLALQGLDIKVDKYFASEIEKEAIAVTQYNFPSTVQLGNVENVYYIDGWLVSDNGSFYAGDIDLIIGGSPCTDFSVAGSGRGMVTTDKIEITSLEQYLELKANGFKFKGQSYLFWEYVRLQRETNSKYFFLENVKMIEKWKNLLSSTVGAEPIFLDSALVSAQRRKRYYWTNIPGYVEPEDYGILLKDIVHENEMTFVDREKSLTITANYQKLTDADYFEKQNGQQVMEGTKVSRVILGELKEYIVPFDKTLKIIEKEIQRGKVGFFRQDSQANRVYFIHDKAVTLCGEAGGGAAKMGQYLFGCITPDRIEKRQNGQRFSEGRKFYTLTAQDQHGILIEGYIRKLTPVECERLQTVPDGYTEWGIVGDSFARISNSKRYKMLGNGWTVEAIKQFFKGLKHEFDR